MWKAVNSAKYQDWSAALTSFNLNHLLLHLAVHPLLRLLIYWLAILSDAIKFDHFGRFLILPVIFDFSFDFSSLFVEQVFSERCPVVPVTLVH
jgi:hypothetical protein